MDAWINEPEQESDDEPKADKGSLDIFYKTSTSVSDFRDGYQGESVYEETEHMQSEDVRQSAARQQVRREALRVEQANNPHYLKASSQARQSPSASSQLLSPASEEIPVMSINLSVPLQVSTSKKLSDKYLELERNKEASSDSKKHRSKRDKKKKKKKGNLNWTRITEHPVYYIANWVEMQIQAMRKRPFKSLHHKWYPPWNCPKGLVCPTRKTMADHRQTPIAL